MKCAVIVFPGSNCDRDCYHVMSEVHGVATQYIWHKATQLPPVDCVVLPGGFSYGDYLRAGAIAHGAPIMRAVKEFAANGGRCLGICNGFQILTEAGLLPGALLRNASLKFECRNVYLRYSSPLRGEDKGGGGREDTLPLAPSPQGRGGVIRMPIAHMDGNYFVDNATFAVMERQGQIVFRYCDREGAVTAAANPNGSLHNIAGVCNRERNVIGLMPHPERCCEAVLGGTDGKGVFASLLGMS